MTRSKQYVLALIKSDELFNTTSLDNIYHLEDTSYYIGILNGNVNGDRKAAIEDGPAAGIELDYDPIMDVVPADIVQPLAIQDMVIPPSHCSDSTAKPSLDEDSDIENDHSQLKDSAGDVEMDCAVVPEVLGSMEDGNPRGAHSD